MSDLLPNNQVAERAVIGSVLIYPSAYNECSKYIVAADFYVDRHRWLWQAIEAIVRRHEAVDMLTVSAELSSTGKLSDSGGDAYMLQIVNDTPTAMNAEYYAKIVCDLAKRRRLIDNAGKLAKNAFDQNISLDEFIPKYLTSLMKEIQTEAATEHISIGLRELYDDIQKRAENPQEVFGIPCGISGIDRITGGMQAGELFLLSGEPGLGKSLLAMQIAFKMGLKKPGVIYELEMSKLQTMRRQLSNESNVSVRAMKTGFLNESDRWNINEAIARMENLPIYFSDSSSWNTASLRADLIRLKQLYGIEWFVVDYLRLLKDRVAEKETERIGIITSNLHDICKDLNIFGLAIQSMTKAGFREGGMEGVYGGSELHHSVDVMAIMTKDQDYDTNKIVNLTFDKVRESEDDVRLVKLRNKPGFPYFAELEYKK